MSSSQESLAVSLRIPNELLTKIDQLAEERFKSIKGKPNRSLAILHIIDEYFNTVPDNVSNQVISTVSDSVTRLEFDELKASVDELKQLINTVSDTEIVVSTEVASKTTEGEIVFLSQADLANRLKVDKSNLSHLKSPKSNKSDEQILGYTRKKDPEGIGWLPVKGKGSDWEPERVLGGDPNALQVELLRDVPSAKEEGC